MKRRDLYPLVLWFVIALGVIPSRGQIGNTTNPEPEDPTGNAGTVKSTVETGGSYNSSNGNATRSITDLQVPGVPGVYGLDFTRHWNSTDPSFSPFGSPGPRPFGSGGWTHSWNWSAAPDMRPIDCDGEGNNCEDGYYGSFVHIINVEYPDGRTARFSFARTNPDPDDPEPQSPDPYPPTLRGALGTDDHLGGIDENGEHFWLYTADGGSVYFRWFNSGYRATRVVDPHGLSTYLTYDSDGFTDRLTRVAGPDGRSIFLEWGGFGNTHPAVITKVGWGVTPGSYLQTVEYAYTNYTINNPADGVPFSWYALTGAKYMDDVNAGELVKAVYTYTPVATHDTDDTPGTPSPQGRGPLLTTADDPRYEGPMTRIRYVFRGGPGGEPFCQSVDPIPWPGNIGPSMMYAPFPVQKEVSLDTGAVVSELYIPCNGMPDTGMRLETRGAGGARTFQFGKKGGLEPGYQYIEHSNGGDEWIPPEADPGSGAWGYNAGFEITRLTDFADNPNPATMPTDFHHNFRVKPWRIFDARGILTEYKYQTGLEYTGPASNGRVKEIFHRGSDQTKRTYNWDPGSAVRDVSRIPNTFNHWLFSQTDERTNVTAYTRDSLMRVTQISYHGAGGALVASESFTYNGFSQVTSHTLPSGAVKYYDYNGSFLWREWNDVDTVAEATIYTPDSFGRVATAQNARARAAGAAYSAWMEYNSRHQVTKVHYPSTGGNADPTVIYEYDKYGNCTAITNELGFRSTYTYDSYRRCLSYTEPVNAPACGGSSVGTRTWNWLYDRIAEDGPKDASTHTSNKWRLQTEPVFNAAGHRRFTARDYDYNDRLNFEFVGAILLPGGAWDLSQGAMHSYKYDENGNKKEYTDPDGRVTTYDYDNRNRMIRTNETINRIARTTRTDYDATGNKIQVTFPDTWSQRWVAHDPFGQPAQFFDERNNITDLTYQWGPMKKLDTVRTYRAKDSGGTETQLTDFEYDGLGRPKQTLFHDGSKEVSSYQFGQLKTWTTRDEKVKTITSYDARGREQAHIWSDGTPGITRLWDDAGRLLTLVNSVSAIDYSYDQAGQVRAEGTTVAGSMGQAASGRKEVSYCRYPSGEVSQVTYPNGLTLQRAHTARGQLQSVGWGSGSTSYVYRSDGKVDYQAFTNGVTTTYGYNGRGFVQSVAHRHGSVNLSERTYWRDNRDRIEAWKRGTQNSVNGMEDGRGDRYGYDQEGQLTHASYRALNPETGSPGEAKRGDIFHYDALGNRMGADNQLASRGPMEFLRRNNGLNQYTAWMPTSYVYYDDSIPTDWTAPGNGNLMQDGWITASFNSLNQPVAMWSPIYPGGGSPHYLWFGYDPLGRCVKRWMGTGTGTPVGANPSTYLYYDVWNLVQEGTAGNSPTRLYVHGGRVDEVVASYVVSSNQWAYHHYDARGHCALLTDMAGGIREQYEYDAFGLTYFHSASGARLGSALHWGNRFLFTGREWLKDLRVYDFRNRVYQPELGRFLQPDPIQFQAGEYNLYRYCHNDPVNRTDPSGLFEWAFSPDYPVNGPGVVAGRETVQRAIDIFRATARGSELQEMAPDKVVVIRPTSGNQLTGRKGDDLYLNPKDALFRDPRTKADSQTTPANETPPETDKGRAVIIGHEVGHLVVPGNDGRDPSKANPDGRNVQKNENPIRGELGVPERRTYGRWPIRP